MRGKKLVLEENGTEIDDDDVLHRVLADNMTLMVLSDGECWKPAGGDVIGDQL